MFYDSLARAINIVDKPRKGLRHCDHSYVVLASSSSYSGKL